MKQLFPRGTRHLPEPLAARGVYRTRPRGGFRFALFRLPDGDAATKEGLQAGW